jgi:serine/threonine protein kinase
MISDESRKGNAAATDERIGSVLSDRYRIDRLLGAGSKGNVYAGEHLLMHKKVAVKILHRELSSMPEFTARFEREAMAVANIDHPNVAAATDFGKLPDGSMFLVLEFVQGRCLRDEIAAGPLPPDRALRITRQIAAALGSAHALGIVHRDLKPENVMLLDREGDPDFVKVLDFGVAQVPVGDTGVRSKAPLTQAGIVFGTPEYMAPEQALGQKVDGRADLYALGVITFEMLSGERPFSSSGEGGILNQQLSKPPPSLSARAPAVRAPIQAEQLVTRLLATDARNRFQTCDELVQALDDVDGLRAGEVATSAPATRILGSVAQSYGARGVPRVPPSSPAQHEQAPRQSSVARVTAKESFSADEPLPAFTFPVLDEATKQELLRNVEAVRAAKGQLAPAVPPPSVRPLPKLSERHFSRSFSELHRIGLNAWKRASALARRWFESACKFIDRNRSRLPVRLRDPLTNVRSEWIVGCLTMLAFGIVIGLLAHLGSEPSEKPAPVERRSAPLVPP